MCTENTNSNNNSDTGVLEPPVDQLNYDEIVIFAIEVFSQIEIEFIWVMKGS